MSTLATRVILILTDFLHILAEHRKRSNKFRRTVGPTLVNPDGEANVGSQKHKLWRSRSAHSCSHRPG
jgi:hypothetical protein